MPTDATIRPAERGDGEGVLRLWLRLLEEQARLDAAYAPAPDAPERWRNDFPEWLRDRTRLIVVAVADGDLVGFVTARAWSLPPIYAGGDEVHLDELYVESEHRRNGLGRRLVEAVRRWAGAQGAQRVQLGVLARNEGGNAFWRRCGAQPLSVTYVLDVCEPRSTAPNPAAPSPIRGFEF